MTKVLTFRGLTMSNTSLKQKCIVWCVVVFVLVCAIGHIVERVLVKEPTTEDIAQQLIDAIEDTMVYPKTWWSDRTLTIYYVEVAGQLRTTTPNTPKAAVLQTRLNHYYSMMVERGII